MSSIPFLRPRLVSVEDCLPYLRRIDETQIYANFGPLNEQFEGRILAEYFRGNGAVTTVQNATAGLILAIQAVKRAGKYAVMPSFTFAATPQAALWCGLTPYFVDIRADDFCLNESLLAETVERLGNDVAVVVPYAAFGTACSLEYCAALHRSGVPVVVDAAASFGTSVEGYQFGFGFPGAVAYSFHATKAFGIGEGGLVYSEDEALIDRVRKASNFGFSGQRESVMQGLNAKLPEYSAAVGLATLDRFHEKTRRRREVYRSYLEDFDRQGLWARGWGRQAVAGEVPHQFMTVLCPPEENSRRYVDALASRMIQARTYFAPPCHRHELFAAAPASPLQKTEEISRRVLSLPLWEEITPADISRVVKALVEA